MSDTTQNPQTAQAPISRDDLKAKLVNIQDDVTSEAQAKKSQFIGIGLGALAVVLLLAFLLGRKGGVRKSTVIEITRA